MPKFKFLFHPIKSSVLCFPPGKSSCNSTRGHGGKPIPDEKRPRSLNQTVGDYNILYNCSIFLLWSAVEHTASLCDIVTANYQLQ